MAKSALKFKDSVAAYEQLAGQIAARRFVPIYLLMGEESYFIDAIAEQIYRFEEVRNVYLMSGGYDLSATVTGKTMSDIAMFVAKRLATIDGVLSTATHFLLTKYKDGGVVFASDYEEIDERGSNLCD